MEIEEIERLAELSKLKFSQKEMADLAKDFESLIELADVVRNANITGKTRIASVDMDDLREDRVKESVSTEVLLQNAPISKKDSFVVPRIME